MRQIVSIKLFRLASSDTTLALLGLTVVLVDEVLNRLVCLLLLHSGLLSLLLEE